MVSFKRISSKNENNLAISLLFEMAEYPAITQRLIKLLNAK